MYFTKDIFVLYYAKYTNKCLHIAKLTLYKGMLFILELTDFIYLLFNLTFNTVYAISQ